MAHHNIITVCCVIILFTQSGARVFPDESYTPSVRGKRVIIITVIIQPHALFYFGNRSAAIIHFIVRTYRIRLGVKKKPILSLSTDFLGNRSTCKPCKRKILRRNIVLITPATSDLSLRKHCVELVYLGSTLFYRDLFIKC